VEERDQCHYIIVKIKSAILDDLQKPSCLEIDAHHQGPFSVIGARQHHVHDPIVFFSTTRLTTRMSAITVVRPARQW
jgi:hypothetical protein